MNKPQILASALFFGYVTLAWAWSLWTMKQLRGGIVAFELKVADRLRSNDKDFAKTFLEFAVPLLMAIVVLVDSIRPRQIVWVNVVVTVLGLPLLALYHSRLFPTTKPKSKYSKTSPRRWLATNKWIGLSALFAAVLSTAIVFFTLRIAPSLYPLVGTLAVYAPVLVMELVVLLTAVKATARLGGTALKVALQP
jgi:hypothetical protein